MHTFTRSRQPAWDCLQIVAALGFVAILAKINKGIVFPTTHSDSRWVCHLLSLIASGFLYILSRCLSAARHLKKTYVLGLPVLAFSCLVPAIASEADSTSLEPTMVALAAPTANNISKRESASAQQDWDIKGQITYIYQEKPAFNAAYTLPEFNSLSTLREQSHSMTSTAYLGFRPWSGAEFYYDEEMVLGVPFSGLNGLASVPNAELQKASGPNPLVYRPRAFLRQNWSLGGGVERVESGINQLAGYMDRHRLVLTAGNFSIIDIFDNNTFAHDGRTDFFNWVNVDAGAFDYAADVRGYTWGAALEYYDDDWVFRAGRFIVPRESNGLQLNYSIMNFHGDQIEIEHAHQLAGQVGKVRFLAFRNVELMGKFQDALDYATTHGGGAPNVENVSRPNVKHGYGINLEQHITNDLGVFGRSSWNDGGTEMFSYTEVERSQQAGVSLKGASWGRVQDTLGMAFVRNGLSKVHQEYLAAGGTGFLIGDGKLDYRPEQVFEDYYSLALMEASWLTFDFQHINNPAYNADRGPVNIWGIRLHSDF